MKLLYSPALLALLSLFLLNVSPIPAQAADAKPKSLPFHGKLAAVDAGANTITLSGKSARVFHLTAETKITDGGGNATTLASAVVGEDVGGSYLKDSAGTLTLKSVRLGAKTGTKTASTTPSPTAAAATATPAPPPAAASPATPSTAAPEKAADAPTAAPAAAPAKVKKERFSGKVVSVDAAGKTLVVHGKADQTFTVTSDTKITGSATDLSGVTAGTKVSGSYTKAADGSLTLATLKVGK
jgi:hypothetical protein